MKPQINLCCWNMILSLVFQFSQFVLPLLLVITNLVILPFDFVEEKGLHKQRYNFFLHFFFAKVWAPHKLCNFFYHGIRILGTFAPAECSPRAVCPGAFAPEECLPREFSPRSVRPGIYVLFQT